MRVENVILPPQEQDRPADQASGELHLRGAKPDAGAEWTDDGSARVSALRSKLTIAQRTCWSGRQDQDFRTVGRLGLEPGPADYESRPPASFFVSADLHKLLLT